MATIPNPKNPLYWLATKSYAYELAIAFFLIPGGIANACRAFWSQNNESLAGWLWVSSVCGVFVCSVAKIAAQYREVWSKESPADLDGCLHVLHSVLTSQLAGVAPRVRVTIYIPTRQSRYLMQAVQYVGEASDKKKVGREWPIQCGIIGRAFQEKTPQIGERLNMEQEAFVAELVADWGFSEADARDVDAYTRSWLAVPLLENIGGRVYGVVFADATASGFWTDERQDVVFGACAGIASFVTRRYK